MDRRAWVTATLSAGFVVMWSSGFIGGRLGTQSASTLSLMSWRFLLLAPVIVLVLALLARSRYGLHLRAWPRQALIGTLSLVLYLGGTVGAIELGVGAGTSAIIASLQPLAAGALAGPLLGESTSARQWAGLALGFAGVLIAVGGDLSVGAAPWWAYLLPVAGMLALVAGTLLEARSPGPELPIVESLGVQCLAAAAVFTLLAVGAGQLDGPHLAQGGFWAALAWFIAFSTLGGYGFYWLTLRRAGTTRVSSLMYLTPPVTAVWAWAMFGDAVPVTGLAGFAVCAAGVATVFARRRPASAPTLPPLEGESVISPRRSPDRSDGGSAAATR